MSQTDLQLPLSGVVSGLAFATEINAHLAALASKNSGATEPGTTFPFMDWIDTSVDPVAWKVRNAANDAWIEIGTLSSGNVFVPTIGAGAITQTMIADGAISTGKIADLAITSGKIGSGAVVEAKIGSGAVVEAKLGDGAVTTNKLANSGVTAASYTNANITIDAKGRITTAANGSAGDWVRLGNLNITSAQATAVVDGIGSSYLDLMLVFDLLPASNGVDLIFMARTGSGSDVVNAYWSRFRKLTGSEVWGSFDQVRDGLLPVSDNNNGQAILAPVVRNNATDGGASGFIVLNNIQSGRHKRATWEAGHYHGSGDRMNNESRGNAQFRTTAPITGGKFIFSSGDVAEGRVAIFGRT